MGRPTFGSFLALGTLKPAKPPKLRVKRAVEAMGMACFAESGETVERTGSLCMMSVIFWGRKAGQWGELDGELQDDR